MAHLRTKIGKSPPPPPGPKLAGIWGLASIREYSAGIANFKIFSNWELGFELKINWELGLGTPHHDSHRSIRPFLFIRDLLSRVKLLSQVQPKIYINLQDFAVLVVDARVRSSTFLIVNSSH